MKKHRFTAALSAACLVLALALLCSPILSPVCSPLLLQPLAPLHSGSPPSLWKPRD